MRRSGTDVFEERNVHFLIARSAQRVAWHVAEEVYLLQQVLREGGGIEPFAIFDAPAGRAMLTPGI